MNRIKSNGVNYLKSIVLGVLLLVISLSGIALAQEIKVEKMSENISVLIGNGGNVGILTGDDGAFVIDTMVPNMSAALNSKLAELTGNKPVRFVINTHWHYDHIGGNETLSKEGATIIAHENVRKRMSTEQNMEFFKTKVPPSAQAALPKITFEKDMMFYLNGEEIHVFHVNPSHTDGDSMVYFKKANVLHTGDLYFNGEYPFIDISSGGSLNGMIEVAKSILPKIDDNTKIIPGHGPVSNKTEYKKYLEMLIQFRDKIGALIKSGKTLEEVIAAKPTKEYDEKWVKDFLKPDQFVTLLYSDLSRKKK